MGTGHSDAQSIRRNAAAAFVTALAVLYVFVGPPSLNRIAGAQTRQRQGRQRPPIKAPAKNERDYSLFKHEDHRKELNGRELACSSCHTIASPQTPDRIAAATKPSVALGFPYHDSCLRCHQRQFYRGNFPVICTVCHTRVSPRLTARDVYPQFPGPRQSQVITREFPGYFPHGLHQSLMARQPRRAPDSDGELRLVKALFVTSSSDKIRLPEVCSTCHLTDERGPVALPLKGIQDEETLKRIEADTFKSIPGDGQANAHASCFNCHWQAQKPTQEDCHGCHLARADYAARKLVVTEPAALSPNALKWFENWPAGMPKRFSLKFRHNTHTLSPDGKTESNNHDVGCTACHLNIAQMTTLSIPKADVQIAACARCHARDSAIPVAQGSKITIWGEMELKADASKKYTCIACHTSVIGREPPPCSHYAVKGEPCPGKELKQK